MNPSQRLSVLWIVTPELPFVQKFISVRKPLTIGNLTVHPKQGPIHIQSACSSLPVD